MVACWSPGDELKRYEPDGTTVVHADLTRVSKFFWSEMTVDGAGNIYVNSIGFDFREMSERVRNPTKSPAGVIALITPDGSVQKVAAGIVRFHRASLSENEHRQGHRSCGQAKFHCSILRRRNIDNWKAGWTTSFIAYSIVDHGAWLSVPPVRTCARGAHALRRPFKYSGPSGFRGPSCG
jgi:hypothetical protein